MIQFIENLFISACREYLYMAHPKTVDWKIYDLCSLVVYDDNSFIVNFPNTPAKPIGLIRYEMGLQ